MVDADLELLEQRRPAEAGGLDAQPAPRWQGFIQRRIALRRPGYDRTVAAMVGARAQRHDELDVERIIGQSAGAPRAAPRRTSASLPDPADIRTREILGLPIAMTDYEQAMDVMDGMIARRERGYVCAVAVHAVMVAQRDPEMRDALLGSTLTVPDGMPLVWAANLLGENLPRPRLRPRADAPLQPALRRRRATASGSTAAATRAPWSSSRCACASATPASRSSAATRRPSAR